MPPFDTQYQLALRNILETGHPIFNERTGHEIKALPGVTLQMDLAESFPLLTLRKIPIPLFVAEMIWYIHGSNNPDDYVNHFTGIWKEFTESDGTVAAAYGHRWRRHFGRDQLGDLVRHLAAMPGSRHGVVVTWDPRDDGLSTGTPKKNVPCPYTFTVNVMGGALHLHNIVRSNDMILGCPHDVAGFALLAYILAAKLGVRPGILTHSISNAHIYDIHYEAGRELLTRTHDHSAIPFLADPSHFDRAEKGDKTLVEEITKLLSEKYQPLAAIKGLKIVL
ncbi:MAG: Thymidylate synthase [Parcubacteria group bacterium Gr01-1014_18]|nr:MAG: Thymidylate synthase [Parcubacteria group bacterium Greene0416_36]TSC79780.1 MAG: Thymidylate synthase [Parcubacteria group bacterium Gr01-1014_18]TSC98064.1 MAG: Thymidylate synthase [Parcubacteria group bacterium Greene1014_20]TSD06500.1 MAG: Thymidylate synthase [Parcubacteria group bacterium Greene0714_2]